ncbi:MAG: hypothetical protein ACI8UZ_002552, partial [Akkermansiaceae bacterium]
MEKAVVDGGGLDPGWFPEFRVFSLPEFFRHFNALDLDAFTVGDVAEVAEHRALLGVGDFGVED